MFNASRFGLARRRRKLTKKLLAEAMGVDQKTVIRYESGESVPPPSSLDILAETLDFPVEFFFGPDLDEPQVASASFRSMSAMPAKERDSALAAGSFAFLLSDWVDNYFVLPSSNLIDGKEGVEPEAAARALRTYWGLGEKPIKSMVHLLEAKGVRVFSLVENTKTIDAFSLWRRNIPFVFLNTVKTPERSRFDAAHELGHLVLHKHGGPQGGRVVEEQANQFASAFLMPEAEVRARMPAAYSLDEIVRGKAHWGVSTSALNYRLHKLGITSEYQYRRFCIQIMEKYRSQEPHPIDREVSQLWSKVFTELRNDGIHKHRIAKDLSLPVQEIENLVFGLTKLQSIDGKGTGSGRGIGKLEAVHLPVYLKAVNE